MLTAQAIKDQEFQIKFRGYDAIEVRAYLELLADDYFELAEQNRVQAEEIESLMEQLETLQRDKEALALEVKESRESAGEIQAEIEQGYKHKDKEIEELTTAVKSLEEEKQIMVEEAEKNKRQIEEFKERLAGDANVTREEVGEIEKLRARIEILEQQNSELKQEGIDFKTTILAAQKFADSLRETSEQEAQKLMDDAQAEVDNFRQAAESELARLPQEIESLKRRREEVREELRGVLESYLKGLELFTEEDSQDRDEDDSELFQSIVIPED